MMNIQRRMEEIEENVSAWRGKAPTFVKAACIEVQAGALVTLIAVLFHSVVAYLFGMSALPAGAFLVFGVTGNKR
jgi:hypothetical protein